MKFMKIEGCELESLRALKINENEFAIYMQTEEGNTPVVIENETRPRIFGSMEELTKVAQDLVQVGRTKGDAYAWATFE